jgi:hypothetical protein
MFGTAIGVKGANTRLAFATRTARFYFGKASFRNVQTLPDTFDAFGAIGAKPTGKTHGVITTFHPGTLGCIATAIIETDASDFTADTATTGTFGATRCASGASGCAGKARHRVAPTGIFKRFLLAAIVVPQAIPTTAVESVGTVNAVKIVVLAPEKPVFDIAASRIGDVRTSPIIRGLQSTIADIDLRPWVR